MVGARVRDGGGSISDIQRLARLHAQRIGGFGSGTARLTSAVGTLFNPVSRIEAVQSMSRCSRRFELRFSSSRCLWRKRMAPWRYVSFCLLALMAGHAVRMAIDMGINRSFIQLLRTGMGKGKTPEQLEEERYLVVHSRVWLCVRLSKYVQLTKAIPDRAPDGIWHGTTGNLEGRRNDSSVPKVTRAPSVNHLGRSTGLYCRAHRSEMYAITKCMR